MRKPSDLNPTQRKSYDLWRDLGLTKAAAMNALVEDGVVRLSEEEKLARRFSSIFGLSEEAAEFAARGRDGGPSSRPVSEGAPAVEDNITWHRRMMRELAEMDRELAEVAEAQKKRLVREIAEDIARIQAQERRRLQLKSGRGTD
jgi:hypothetical protein